MRHVTLTCKHHPELRWNTKAIACPNGQGYNGARNIFYNGAPNSTIDKYPCECSCPPSDLIWAPEEDGKDLGL